MDDLQLLREYAQHRSESAFTELVRRHVDLVYSTAFRLMHERSLAEDVTQLVFIRLSRKAASLGSGIILTGWLYRTTQYVAQTDLRSAWRRRQRESLAMELSELQRDHESTWREVGPLLEQAIAKLRPADQDAVVLRFFAGKSLREVGEALGVSDDTAQKRVNRALERMREFFASQGVVVSTAVVGPAIAAHAVQVAPAGLASSLVTAGLAVPVGGVGVATAIQGLKAVVLAHLKTVAAGTVFASILIYTGAVAWQAAPANPTLPPALTLRGIVHSPDGQPLAGALVRVATPQHYVRLYQITNAPPATNRTNLSTNSNALSRPPASAPRQAPSTRTARDGTFAIGLPELPEDGLAAVVINSDAGYALVTAGELSANPDVVVQPWARLEGVVRVGKAVATNATVNLGIWGATALFDWNLVQHSASTRTDSEGRFVFPQIAPVDVWLTRTVQVRTNDGRQSGHQYVKVRPGDRLQVQLGGMGRAVTGRVDWNAASAPSTNPLVFYGSMWADAEGGIRHPRNWKSLSREEQRQFERAWRDSPAGEVFKNSVRNYEFPVQRDGTFRVDDVRPGRYRMQVRADEPRPDGRGSRQAAVVETEVDVPEGVAGENEEAIDLGTLEPTPARRR